MAWQMINANIDGQIMGTKYFGHRPINMQQTRNGQNKILEDFLKLGVWFRGNNKSTHDNLWQFSLLYCYKEKCLENNTQVDHCPMYFLIKIKLWDSK